MSDLPYRWITLHPALGTGVAAGVSVLLALLWSARRDARRARAELAVASDALLRAQEEVRRLADRDPLTGLSNRRKLPEAFRDCYESGAALVFFDLDDFRRLNEAQGHAAGDDCLVRFAKALSNAFRPTDTIVRYGGDEFLVVCPGMATSLAEDRVDVIRGRFVRHAKTAPVIRFSTGVVELPPGGDAEAVLRQADDAMHAARTGQRIVPAEVE